MKILPDSFPPPSKSLCRILPISLFSSRHLSHCHYSCGSHYFISARFLGFVPARHQSSSSLARVQSQHDHFKPHNCACAMSLKFELPTSPEPRNPLCSHWLLLPRISWMLGCNLGISGRRSPGSASAICNHFPCMMLPGSELPCEGLGYLAEHTISLDCVLAHESTSGLYLRIDSLGPQLWHRMEPARRRI